jgi:hypothetical protein
VVAARGCDAVGDRFAWDTVDELLTSSPRSVTKYLGIIAETRQRYRRKGEGLTQEQRDHLAGLVERMTRYLPEPVPRILARRVRRELRPEEIALSPKLIGRLDPCARGPDDVGAATALLVSLGGDRVGHCRRLEVDVWDETKAQICTPMRAAPDVAMQVERAIAFTVRAGLLKTPHVVCWWDLPEESLAIKGPSLGLAVVAALWSAVQSVKLPCTWAFTGELGPMGVGVEAVAGLDRKLEAADAAGCTDVVLPAANYNSRLAERFPNLRLWCVSDASEVVSLLASHRDASMRDARGQKDPPPAPSRTPPPTRSATLPKLPAMMIGGWMVGLASLLIAAVVVGAVRRSGEPARSTRDVEGGGVPVAPVVSDAAPPRSARGSRW